jgi:hypothetical protein
VYVKLASQALPREPAAAPACAFAATNATTLMAVPPELPSPALTACLCPAVSMSMFNQHRTQDRLRVAVPARAANRANPLAPVIAVGLAHCQRVATAVILLHVTVDTLL